MNRKLVSVFFSALVCSTLGHEYLKANEFQGHHERSHSVGFHQVKTNDQQCSYICPVPSPSPECAGQGDPLKLEYIKETKVFALINTTSEVAIVLQIGEPIALLSNGKTGVSIVINIEKQTVVYYPAGSNEHLWTVSDSNLLSYLQNLGPLTSIINWKHGQTFKISAVIKQVKNDLISIIKHLDFAIAIRVQKYPDSSVSLVSVLIHGLLESSDVVQLLLEKLDSTVTVVNGGLQKLVNLVVGLKAVGKKLNGGLQSLIRNGTSVSLLLGEYSGISSLFNLMIQANVDLTKILADLLKSPEAILGLAVHLDGGKYMGISGITAAIYNVQLYAAKKISLEALIDILIQVQAENSYIKISKERWNRLLKWYFIMAESQVSEYNTGSSWSNLNKFFQDIKEEKLVTNGINVSAIINIIISTSGTRSLGTLLKILLQLKPVCSLSKIIATLYFRLICFVISGQGLIFVSMLLPDVSLTINFSSTASILKQILSSVNVFQITSYLLRLDIVGAITHLPVLGPILKAVEDATKAVGIAAEVSVASSLKATGSIFNDLKDLILFGLGKGGSKGPTDWGIAGISALGGGMTVSVTSSWTSSEVWSSSHGGSAGPSGSSSQSQGGSGASGGHKEFGWSFFG